MLRGGDLLLIWPCCEPQKRKVFGTLYCARKPLDSRAAVHRFARRIGYDAGMSFLTKPFTQPETDRAIYLLAAVGSVVLAAIPPYTLSNVGQYLPHWAFLDWRQSVAGGESKLLRIIAPRWSQQTTQFLRQALHTVNSNDYEAVCGSTAVLPNFAFRFGFSRLFELPTPVSLPSTGIPCASSQEFIQQGRIAHSFNRSRGSA